MASEWRLACVERCCSTSRVVKECADAALSSEEGAARCLIRCRDGAVVANFVVDPRISFVELSEVSLGFSVFDYSQGSLIECDFVLVFSGSADKHDFCSRFGKASAAMASKIVEELFNGTSACFEEDVLRAARKCGGKDAVLEMMKNGEKNVLVDALEPFVEAVKKQQASKARKLGDVLDQLNRKLRMIEEESMDEDVRRQKLKKYFAQQSIVTSLFKLYQRLESGATNASDLQYSYRLLEQIRTYGESCRNIFEGETLKLIKRQQQAREDASEADSPSQYSEDYDDQLRKPLFRRDERLVSATSPERTLSSLSSVAQLASPDDEFKQHQRQATTTPTKLPSTMPSSTHATYQCERNNNNKRSIFDSSST